MELAVATLALSLSVSAINIRMGCGLSKVEQFICALFWGRGASNPRFHPFLNLVMACFLHSGSSL